MKKVISLLLCIVMIALPLAGCTAEEEEDKGAIIPIYLSEQLCNFDPAFAYTDDSAIKVLGLIFEGLMVETDSGKIDYGVAKKWTYKEDLNNETYIMEFQLRDTAWSDGRQVSADDFVYAWKRIMEPEFQSEAASMLMDIKNAKKVKLGDVSIDDLGVYAADTKVLQVEFEHSIDPNLFLEYCASPMLVPLREDAVNKDTDWSTNVSILVTNGPFTVRTFVPVRSSSNKQDKQLVLERNIYFRRDVENDSVKKYVTPYRLTVDYENSADAALTSYEDGNTPFIGYISLSQRAEYADKVELNDTMSTHTYVFNTRIAPFDNADVRRALSLAIDRNAIVDIVKFAKAASGFVCEGVTDANKKTDFREVGGTLIDASANMTEAKNLISKANVKNKSFTITIRPNEVDRAVAEYCSKVWGELGFNVKIRELSITRYESEKEYLLYADDFMTAYNAKDFDVIAIDWQAASTDAWSVLAPFAVTYSGSALDLSSGVYEYQPHISGYNSEAYNAVIEEISQLKTKAERAEKLHEAEKILSEDMPVMPLFVYQDAYLIASDLKKVSTNPLGYFQFKKANYKGYVEAVESIASENVGEETDK